MNMCLNCTLESQLIIKILLLMEPDLIYQPVRSIHYIETVVVVAVVESLMLSP